MSHLNTQSSDPPNMDSQRKSDYNSNKIATKVIDEQPATRQIMPTNFWTTILRLEKEIQNNTANVTFDKIQDLISHYRQALEYFDDNDDEKQFNHYKKKLRDIHNYQNVLEVLAKQPKEPKKRSPPMQPKPQPSVTSLPTLGQSNLNTQLSDEINQNPESQKQGGSSAYSGRQYNTWQTHHTNQTIGSSENLFQNQKQRKSQIIPIKEEDVDNFWKKEEKMLENSSVILDNDQCKQKDLILKRISERKNIAISKGKKKNWPRTPNTLKTTSELFPPFQSNKQINSERADCNSDNLSSAPSAGGMEPSMAEQEYVEKFIKLFLQNQEHDLKAEKDREIAEICQQIEDKQIAIKNTISNESTANKLIEKLEKQKQQKIQEIDDKWQGKIDSKITGYTKNLENTRQELYINESMIIDSPGKQNHQILERNNIKIKKSASSKKEDQIQQFNTDNILQDIHSDDDDNDNDNDNEKQEKQEQEQQEQQQDQEQEN